MRAAVVTDYGSTDNIKVFNNLPVPKIGQPNEVLIKVAYAGINPIDVIYTVLPPGSTPPPTFSFVPKPKFTPGYDGSGIVEQVGSAVTSLKKGDRVWFSSERTAATAEFVLVDATHAYPLPKGVSFAEGAGIGIPYFTAFRAFFLTGHLKKGQTVLVHGASGGVGTAAVQFAVANGNTVAGFDFILELSAHINLARDIELAAQFGEIAIAGTRTNIEINPYGILRKESKVFGVCGFFFTPETRRQTGLAINALFESGVKPVIDKVNDLNDIAKAHQHLVANPGAKGNLVVRIADL